METPNVTQAQIIALVSAVIGLVVTVGLLDDTTAQAVLGVASAAVPLALILADAIIRKGRADNATAILESKAPQPSFTEE